MSESGVILFHVLMFAMHFENIFARSNSHDNVYSILDVHSCDENKCAAVSCDTLFYHRLIKYYLMVELSRNKVVYYGVSVFSAETM